VFTCPVCARVYPRGGRCAADGAELGGDEATSLIGESLGRFRVESCIGRGGMGEVFLAVHPEIGSRVAIKVLNPEAASSPSLVERFFAEARAVNLIRHESIVNVLDMARTPDGRPFLVMEYLEGAPLSAHFARSGPTLQLGWFADVMREVLSALGAAHARGITHRDLKPDNIFVTTLGHAKVLDFGIAKLSPELGVVGPGTHSRALLGTPHYMSPEQARGRPVDARSDLYSVGVVLFEGVTGQRPFSADSIYDLLDLHVRVPPPAPSSLRPDLPPELDRVILRALAKEPEQRFQSASELSAALRAAIGLPDDARSSPRAADALAATWLAPSTPIATPETLAAAARPLSSEPAVRPNRSKSSAWAWALGGLAALGLLSLAAVALAWFVLGRDARATSAQTSEDVLDLRRFDAVEYLPRATAQARAYHKDAELVNMVIPEVDHQGRVDLEASQAYVGYAFRARGTGQGDPNGGIVLGDCSASVVVSRGGVVATKSQGSCNTLIVTPPRCSAARIMSRAGARPGQRATLQYYFSYLNGPTWSVNFNGTSRPIQLVDDC